MPQTQIIEQTIDDYRADQWLWMVHGRLVQDDGCVCGESIGLASPWANRSLTLPLWTLAPRGW